MVRVHHIVIAKCPIFEGCARIVGPVFDIPGAYRVRFDGERIDRVRVILDGPYQTHSEQCIAALRGLWLASVQHGSHLGLLPQSDGGQP